MKDLRRQYDMHPYEAEHWTLVKHHYYIATCGAVLRKEDFNPKVFMQDYSKALPIKLDRDCVAWTTDESGRILFRHHHLMAEAYFPEWGTGKQVHHIDNNPLNLSIHNLIMVDIDTHEKIERRGKWSNVT